MFNKNTRITYELLPDGTIYIETQLNSDVESSANFLSGLFDKTYLQDTLRSIDHYGNRKGRSSDAKEIIGFILESQQEYIPKNDRPLIEADQVFAALQQRINNEGDQ